MNLICFARVLAVCGLSSLGLSFAWAAAGCVEEIVSRLGRANPADADVVTAFAARLPDDSAPARGLIAAIDARAKDADDAILRVRQALDRFPGPGVAEDVFQQMSLVAHADGLGDLLVNMGSSQTNAIGASNVLFFVTNRMNPRDIARFEVPIPGSARRADAQDILGNLIESKADNWDSLPDFNNDQVGRAAFQEVLDQATVFRDHAASQGKDLVLVFSNKVPPKHAQAFQDVLGGFVTGPNVRFFDGV